MASTQFIDLQTVIKASWLNDANAYIYGLSVNVLSYGYQVGDGHDNGPAMRAAIQSLLMTSPTGGTILVPPGASLILPDDADTSQTGFVIPSNVHIQCAGLGSTRFIAGKDDMCVARMVGSRAMLSGCTLEDAGGAYNNVTGIKIAPLDESGTSTVLSLISNMLQDIEILGMDDGLVLMNGPTVASVKSMCSGNTLNRMSIQGCTRSISMLPSINDSTSGCDGNRTFDLILGGSGTNIALNVLLGSNNIFVTTSINNVNSGSTPTGIIIGDNCQNTQFYGLNIINGVRDINNASVTTQMYGWMHTGAYYSPNGSVLSIELSSSVISTINLQTERIRGMHEEIIFNTDGDDCLVIDGDGSIVPVADDVSSLGAADKRFHSVYAKDLSVDGLTLTDPLPIASGGTGNTTGTATVNADLTGPITSVGNATSVAAQTGTGSTFAMRDSPQFTGTPTAPTLADYTNTTGIATTAFTNRVKSMYTKCPVVSTNTTFTTADFGAYVQVTTSGRTISLPTPDASYSGKRFTIAALYPLANPTIVNIAGGGTLYTQYGGGQSSIAVSSGSVVVFTINDNGVYVSSTNNPQFAGNLLAGGSGQIPVQASIDQTGFIAAPFNGQILRGNNSNMPIWSNDMALPGNMVAASFGASSGFISPSYPSGIKGNITGNPVTAGSVGEYKEQWGQQTNPSSGTNVNVSSIALTPGYWYIWGGFYAKQDDGDPSYLIQAGISLTSATQPSGINSLVYNLVGSENTVALIPQHVYISTSQNAYCVGKVFYSTTADLQCELRAVRIS